MEGTVTYSKIWSSRKNYRLFELESEDLLKEEETYVKKEEKKRAESESNFPLIKTHPF